MSTPYVSGWTESLRGQHMSARTISSYVSDLNRYGDLPFTDADHAARSQAIRNSGLSPRTIARHLSAHVAWWRYQHESTESGPYTKPPKMGVVVPHVVPDTSELKRFLAAEDDMQYRAIFTLMAGAGLRVSEALAVRMSDLGPGHSVLRIPNGKGGKMRDVPLSDEVARALDRYWYSATLTRMDAPLFTVSVRTVQRRVKHTARKAGLPATWHPHALRHGFATAVYEATTDLRLTGDLLGHSSVTTTAIYTHVSDKRRVSAVAGVLA